MITQTLEENDIAEKLRSNTFAEILRQPDIWRSVSADIAITAEHARTWVDAGRYDEVWFCGAGTSAFIGDSLEAFLNEVQKHTRYVSVPSTDLVPHPERLFRNGTRRLVVSFGRSGDSPESVATLDLLKHTNCDGLHITCNRQGALARVSTSGQRAIVLPEATHDSAFAMTSSYSTMLLYALSIFDRVPVSEVSAYMTTLADSGKKLIDSTVPLVWSQPVMERIVFLGAGELKGAAHECALKVLELTAGQVASFWETPLGFRHGPKALINERTQVVVLLSGQESARRYELDLVEELRRQYRSEQVRTWGPEGTTADNVFGNIARGWNIPLYVIPAQLLAVVWSTKLGVTVDNPFPSGNLSRVVNNVRLYSLPKTRAQLFGGIDVGGTKVETGLFDEEFKLIARRRNDTVCATYQELLECIVQEARWLEHEAQCDLDVGIGLPGLVDPDTGQALTSNLPATGQPLRKDLMARLNRRVVVENDCKSFALSEAKGGAGRDAETVLGLVIGTGVGGGVVQHGRFVIGNSHIAGEIGHLGIPARFVRKWDLPVVQCGCGRVGCYETLVSGPGIVRLAERYEGGVLSSREIAERAAAGDKDMSQVMREWTTLLAELIYTAQCTIDMDCVVFGGGLSNISGMESMVASAFREQRILGRDVQFHVALFGESSGARGAAMLVRER